MLNRITPGSKLTRASYQRPLLARHLLPHLTIRSGYLGELVSDHSLRRSHRIVYELLVRRPFSRKRSSDRGAGRGTASEDGILDRPGERGDQSYCR